MPNLNKVVLAGYLVRDPERRVTAGGTPLGCFTVAANHVYLDKTGQRQQEAAFVPCVVFGAASSWLLERRKGAALLVSGRLRTETWEKDGHHASRLVLICDSVQFLDGTRGQSDEGPAEVGNSQTRDKCNDEVPF